MIVTVTAQLVLLEYLLCSVMTFKLFIYINIFQTHSNPLKVKKLPLLENGGIQGPILFFLLTLT